MKRKINPEIGVERNAIYFIFAKKSFGSDVSSRDFQNQFHSLSPRDSCYCWGQVRSELYTYWSFVELRNLCYYSKVYLKLKKIKQLYILPTIKKAELAVCTGKT